MYCLNTLAVCTLCETLDVAIHQVEKLLAVMDQVSSFTLC